MSEPFVTVAEYLDRTQADLARERLHAAGFDETLVQFATQASADSQNIQTAQNAHSTYEVQVPQARASEARAILEGVDEQWPPSKQEFYEEFDDADTPGTPQTERERNAKRAYNGAVFGLVFFPLQLYAFWLLLKVILSEDRLDQEHRRLAIIAALINIPALMIIWLFARSLMISPI